MNPFAALVETLARTPSQIRLPDEPDNRTGRMRQHLRDVGPATVAERQPAVVARISGTPKLKLRKMRREMPIWPVIDGEDGRWLALESAYANCRLKPGNVCPHRGIDLTPFEDADGIAVCPGHGLKWNLRTGEPVPYHSIRASGAASEGA